MGSEPNEAIARRRSMTRKPSPPGRPRIEEDEIGVHPSRLGHRRDGVGSERGVVAIGAQAHVERLAGREVVVDDEDLLLIHCGSLSRDG
jgi:hypothetical protein